MTIKGKLDTSNIKVNQALNLISERFNLNTAEDVTCLELVDIIKKELRKSSLWDIVKSKLTAKQSMMIIEESLE